MLAPTSSPRSRPRRTPKTAPAPSHIIDGLLARGERWDPSFARGLLAIARSEEPRSTRLLACLALEYQFRFLTDANEPLLRELGIDLPSTQRRIARNVHLQPRDFPNHLTAECRLYFARFAFTPEEVVEEICSRVRTTPASQEMPPLHHPCNVDEAHLAIATLPPYEREIVERLIAKNVCYWVGEQTPAAINALVEYPEGTVVLVVKLPGSDLELEIKRAGVRGPAPLDVRCEPGIALHHQLWGGSRGDYIRYETAASALLARIHRLVHGEEAPVPRVVTLCRIDHVPTDGGSLPVLSYFRQLAKDREMSLAVDRFGRDHLSTPDGFPAAQFLEATRPAQAILTGTSSFRLNRILPMLEQHDVDEILDEVIDDYVPMRSTVDAALAVNRANADRTYVSLLTQLGHFWGTVLGIRGSSTGESFAARNIGLRKLWLDGRWQVRLISMDHDALQLAGRTHFYFNPWHGFNGTLLDQTHILGGVAGKRFVQGDVRTLRAIYRVSRAVAEEGLAAFHRAVEGAYAATQAALVREEEIRGLFREEFVDTLREWDRAVVDYFASRRDPRGVQLWRRRTRARLRRRGMTKEIEEQYLETIEECRDLLPWFLPLYRG
ncbi:MAG TPA: hypothetical protein VGF69_14155 [Thermoanaerobaculia bacterium]